jgi:hypothetical protein
LIVQQDELRATKDPKKVQVHRIIQAENEVQDPNVSTTGTIATSSGSRRVPFPIYTLAFSKNKPKNGVLFSGGGDRYVTVWRKQQQTSSSPPQGRNEDLWTTASQKLGPHTGWVKDVYYDGVNEILHSIGCNCIESWKKMPTEKENDEPILFSHWKKSTIESSPTAGSTLSSDLLCLCGTTSIRQGTNNENLGRSKMMDDLLLAGGVDGRIHVWNSKGMGNHLYSAGQHMMVGSIVYAFWIKLNIF